MTRTKADTSESDSEQTKVYVGSAKSTANTIHAREDCPAGPNDGRWADKACFPHHSECRRCMTEGGDATASEDQPSGPRGPAGRNVTDELQRDRTDEWIGRSRDNKHSIKLSEIPEL